MKRLSNCKKVTGGGASALATLNSGTKAASGNVRQAPVLPRGK